MMISRTCLLSSFSVISGSAKRHQSTGSYLHLRKAAPVMWNENISDHSVEVTDSKLSPAQTIGSRSQSIPITNPISRTPSEIQLYHDEIIADQRDQSFFLRLMSGIRNSTEKLNEHGLLRYENECCLANILYTRQRMMSSHPNNEFQVMKNCLHASGTGIAHHSTYVHVNPMIASTTAPSEQDEEQIFDLEL